MTRTLLVIYFIIASMRYRVAPWKFFQLNSGYFNERKGIFSKLEMDRVIPKRWRLRQWLDDGYVVPETFPVFVKPEWGQNSRGVHRADSLHELNRLRKHCRKHKTPYLIQEAACGMREFEIFYIRSADDTGQPEIFSVTETRYTGEDPYPVNSIHNPQSVYVDCSKNFTGQELNAVWLHLKDIGNFRIARVGLRADYPEAIVSGDFQIIEINIFLPMALILLDRGISWRRKHRFIIDSMVAAARMVGTIPAEQKSKRIFFRKVLAHYRIKS